MRHALERRTDIDAAAQEPRQQRRHPALLAQPDAAGRRPAGQLRRAGHRRHAVHSPGLGPRQHGHRDHSRRLHRRVEHARRARLPDLEHAAQHQLSDRHQQRRRRRRRAPGCSATRPRRAAPRAGTADRGRGHQRGAAGAEPTCERVEAAQAARELAEQRLEAEQSKFEVGLSTNFFVVQAQRDLATRRTSNCARSLDYQQVARHLRARRRNLRGRRQRHHRSRRRHGNPTTPAAAAAIRQRRDPLAWCRIGSSVIVMRKIVIVR